MSPLFMMNRQVGRSRRAMLETLSRHLDMVRLTVGALVVIVLASGCIAFIEDPPKDDLTANQRKALTLFTEKALPVMKPCVGCHSTMQNIDFLKGNTPLEVYATLKAFTPPQINYIDPAKSRLVTKAEHAGPAFATLAKMGEQDSEYEVMLEWLRAEQRASSDDGGDGGIVYILTGKIRPTVCTNRATCAPTTISLQGIRPDKTGVEAQVSFLYEVLQTSNAPYLANLKLAGGPEGAYIESPLFLGYTPGKATPTVDGDTFFDVKVNVAANTSKPIGSGFAGLTGIVAVDTASGMPNELAMSFQVIDKYKPDGGATDPSVCKQLASFVTNVKPLLQPCLQCHGEAANNAGAKGNMMIYTAAANDGLSCQQAKGNAADLNNIPATAIIVAPTTGSHTFKHPNPTGWTTAVTAWLTAEKNSP